MSDENHNVFRASATFLLAPALIVVLFFVWSILIEPNLLFVRDYDLNPPRWPIGLSGMRVAVLTDIHAGGRWVDERKIQDIVDKTNAARPDLIVLAGDYVHNTGHTCPLPPAIFCKELAHLKAPCGVYAVLGNHDWAYNGEEVTRAFIDNHIPVLANSAVLLNYHSQKFWLLGIEDLFTRHPNVANAMRAVPIDEPVLVLTHDPNIFPQIPERVNLTIAGHTHGGQVWLPLLHLFAPKMGCEEPYVKDLVVQKNGMLFISIGIGNSVLPIRFLNAPEISVLRLLSTAKN